MKGKRRPRKQSPKGRERERFDKRSDDRSETNFDKATNDISWYTRYPNLLLGAGQFPYPYRPGMDMSLGSVTDTSQTTAKTYTKVFRVPGVLTLNWMPSVGISNVSTDPISVAAKEIYAKVRSVYSSSLDVDAPDFIMYLMSLDSVFSYIAWLKRLYRALVAWSPENYVTPDTLVRAMGISVKNANILRANRTRLWQIINELILQSRKFTCPALMDVFNRHYWMSDNVYTDETSINSQFYLFNLVAVYQFQEQAIPGDTAGNTASGLKMVALPRTGEVQDYYNFGVQLIQALVDWDDAYTINGYLKRAYEGAPQFIVDEMPQEQPLTPVYVPEVLAQIENSRTLPQCFDTPVRLISNLTGFDVAQQPLTNAVISNPQVTLTQNILNSDGAFEIKAGGYRLPPVLSIRSDAPTVADSVVASRMMATISLTSGSEATVGATYAIHAGTEIPISWVLVQYADIDATVVDWGDLTFPQTPVTGGQSTWTFNATLLAVAQFDWHPFSFITVIPKEPADTVTKAKVYPHGDTHNITTISQADLDNLHRVCLFSEFNSFNI